MSNPLYARAADGTLQEVRAVEISPGVFAVATAAGGSGTGGAASTELQFNGTTVSDTHPLPTKDRNGHTGVVTTTNTAPVTGNFHAISILEDTTFSSFVEVGGAGQSMTGFLIPAGVTLFGRITAYTLASGKVRAYTV